MPKTISINDLSDFDRNFLKKHGYFSDKDAHGNSRNEGQDTIGRHVDRFDNFENAITAVTHEIMNRAKKAGVFTTPTYQINEFVLTTEDNAAFIWVMSKKVVQEFVAGAVFKIRL